LLLLLLVLWLLTVVASCHDRQNLFRLFRAQLLLLILLLPEKMLHSMLVLLLTLHLLLVVMLVSHGGQDWQKGRDLSLWQHLRRWWRAALGAL